MTADPYRGVMPEPWPCALRVAGHVVRAESVDDLQVRLRLLGEAIGFTVHETSDTITMTFADGELVTIEEVNDEPN